MQRDPNETVGFVVHARTRAWTHKATLYSVSLHAHSEATFSVRANAARAAARSDTRLSARDSRAKAMCAPSPHVEQSQESNPHKRTYK